MNSNGNQSKDKCKSDMNNTDYYVNIAIISCTQKNLPQVNIVGHIFTKLFSFVWWLIVIGLVLRKQVVIVFNSTTPVIEMSVKWIELSNDEVELNSCYWWWNWWTILYWKTDVLRHQCLCVYTHFNIFYGVLALLQK